MKVFWLIASVAVLAAAAVAAEKEGALIVTMSNAANNELLVYDQHGASLQSVATNGKGGVSGNAGGIEARGNLVAAVNFGSSSVSLFERTDRRLTLRQVVAVASGPVSVAFGRDHLYILGATRVESHRLLGSSVAESADGSAMLLKADGSAAQVGVVPNALVITEKSNVIETVALNGDGSIAGPATLVRNIPANVDAPFGLIARGPNAYVTIAHADEISLVRNGAVVTTTPSSSFPGPVQHAPCWLALAGSFLFSANSPSQSVSRYAVYGDKIVPDLAIAATFSGLPTDVDAGGGLLATIDGEGSVTHISIFSLDDAGNLTLQGRATTANPANGIVILGGADRDN